MLKYVPTQDHSLLILNNNSFDEQDKLTTDGYNRLKKQGHSVDFSNNIKISIPENSKNSFVESLNKFVAKEIILIRREVQISKRMSALLMVSGIIMLYLYYF